ncbi:MAG: hypothetical protein IKO09_03890 [Bacteroidales bacterium]|nr:hypothetical protein [Bacteroidales bacterium]
MRLPFFNQQQPIFILNHDNSVLGAPPFLAAVFCGRNAAFSPFIAAGMPHFPLFFAAGMPHFPLFLRQECRIFLFYCGRNAASPFTMQRNNLSTTRVILISCVFFRSESLFFGIRQATT